MLPDTANRPSGGKGGRAGKQKIEEFRCQAARKKIMIKLGA